MKKRIKVILITLLIFSLALTYSVFTSSAELKIDDQNIATFIFDAKMENELEIPLTNMLPGDEKEYNFSVANNADEKISDVSFEYQIKIKTYHFMPLEIKLYRGDVLVITCDETYSRNNQNELICNAPPLTLNHKQKEKDDYKLVVKFSEEHNDASYSGLVDFLKLEIASWQIT